MVLVRKLSPVICLIALVVILIGRMAMEWNITTILPWSIWILVQFICTLSWSVSTTPVIKAINAVISGIVLITGISLVSGFGEISSLWAFFVLAAFTSVHSYLYDLSMSSSVFRGTRRFVLFLPVGMTLYAIIGLFGWNGGLKAAWIGLFLMVILAIAALIGNRKK
jgi:hypothetical protein